MVRNSRLPELDDRAQHLLKVLVDRYISDGQPVGSRTLARDSGLDLSPATIRNVMCDLEDLGFLSSPHTSAGRIPTVRGYRFFVDSLLKVKPLDKREINRLRQWFSRHDDTGSLIQNASDMLSQLTRLAGVVTLPRREALILRHVEFLPLSDNRVLAILVVNEHEVQNRIIHTQQNYDATQLKQVANYLNEQFCGKNIYQVRETLLGDLDRDRESMNRLMALVIEMADKTFTGPTGKREDYVLVGQTNLMGLAELSDLDKLRQLFEAFNQKRDILNLFDQCLNAQSMQIFIGEEAGFEVLDECSVVTAPYSVDGQVIGVLGVIGPTRMAYGRVIPIVDITAKLMAAALNSTN